MYKNKRPYCSILMLLVTSSLCNHTHPMRQAVLERAIDADGRHITIGPVLPRPYADTNPLRAGSLDMLWKTCPEEIKDISDSWKKVTNLNNARGFRLVTTQLLLFGSTETRKTSIAKAIAAQGKLPFAAYEASQLGNEYKNSACINLGWIFKKTAEMAQEQQKPAVLILSGLEAFVDQDGGAGSYSIMFARLGKLLDEYENSNVFFIGTISDPDVLSAGLQDRLWGSIINIESPHDAYTWYTTSPIALIMAIIAIITWQKLVHTQASSSKAHF